MRRSLAGPTLSSHRKRQSTWGPSAVRRRVESIMYRRWAAPTKRLQRSRRQRAWLPSVERCLEESAMLRWA